jgi:hypothetical protein
MKVRVYVDSFNLYYRALKGTEYRWLNPVQLAESLLDPGDTVDLVRYFTARVSSRAGNPEAPARQQAYLSALHTLPNIRVHYGRFLAKTKIRPLTADPSLFVEVHDTEEKGSDVNLASYLLHDGWMERYEAALVLSQDSDLCEPIRMVKDELKRPVGVVWLDGQQPSKRFRNVCSFIRHVTPSRLAAAQFPGQMLGRNGHPVRKPDDW